MTRGRWLVAVAIALVAVGTACSGGSGTRPSGSSPTQRPVLYNGDVTKIPLSGSAQSPLHWEQPAGLDGDAADVALTDRRFESLYRILLSGANSPDDKRIDPLLSQFFPDGADNENVKQLGDSGGGRLTVGPQWTKVVAVQVSGDRAVISTCSATTTTTARNETVVGRVFTRSHRAHTADWLQGAVVTSPVRFDCAAWARSVAK